MKKIVKKNQCRHMFSSFFIVLLLLCGPASAIAADWVKDDITAIQTNVREIKTNVSGNISTVANEFKMQVDLLQDEGFLLKDSAEQLLNWLNSHRDEYLEFYGNKCDNDSTCGIFREEMRIFIADFSILSDRFPVIEKMGMSDSPIIIKLIDKLPPILIFQMYTVMNRMPDWNKIPEKLSGIYDEIGDPEVFSTNFEPRINVNMTPTERFCELNADRLDNGIDPVRLNRIQLFVSFLKTRWNVAGEIVPDSQTLTIVGEGGSVPLPNLFKMIVHVINFMQDAVSTYRDNINLCRDIRDIERSRLLTLEVQVANCLQLTDFIMPKSRDDVYDLVVDKIDNARNAGISVRQSERSMSLVDNFRNDGDWKEAYLKLCDAYKKIGR
jgi:hypothetical protein